jgi:HAE1 family hydrophobic/amphiphilic exporter-1/multidrug efflux pump
MTVQSDTKPAELSDYAENVISQRLETIPRSAASKFGGKKSVRCVCGSDRINLWLYRFRSETALNQQNVELPSGKLTGDNTELTVKQLETLLQQKSLTVSLFVQMGTKQFLQ